MRFEDTGSFHSGAPLKSILAAARAEGIDACFLGVASPYKGFGGGPAMNLDVKLVETNRGAVLWTHTVGTPAYFNIQAARETASKRILKKFPFSRKR